MGIDREFQRNSNNFLEPLRLISDSIHSIPAKPLLYSTLKCGGFFYAQRDAG